MLDFSCSKCGCLDFKVSAKGQHIICSFCKQKFEWNLDGWIAIVKPNPVQQFFESIQDNVCSALKIESGAEACKRMGIEKIKREAKETQRKEIQLHRLKQRRERMCLNWESEEKTLHDLSHIAFHCDEHKGKLRGKHIARKFSKHLKSKGIKHSVHFGDTYSRVILEVD